MLSCTMRSPLFSRWMMSPYTRHGKDSRSYFVDALTTESHIASSWRHFIMVSTHTQDTSVNGAILSKSYNEAYGINEK
ncbi:hypothetical protein EPI10_001392 [Gossypium australe]|uniref:Uncharacterized protein n=1 Tax=Gossypium australe TaxID=47621 RepID=A0A5B6VB45_9ROSI|nr:hypothetical protein EPI10_001392 [Gossypium australe]